MENEELQEDDTTVDPEKQKLLDDLAAAKTEIKRVQAETKYAQAQYEMACIALKSYDLKAFMEEKKRLRAASGGEQQLSVTKTIF